MSKHALHRRMIPWLLVLVAGATAAAQTEDERSPLEVGLEEQVEVQLVLVDFLVLDRRDRTVPDLTADDLVLVVRGREVPIHSLDLDCPAGAAAEPLPGKRFRPLPPAPTSRPRRMVIVFDYYHMTNVAETFDHVEQMLDKWPTGGEEHMVVSLGEVVRIESPFSTDIDDVRWAVQRMRNDPDLYAGNYGRLTERRFFDRIEVLFDLLERWEGRKSIVLFSGPFLADGFYHDPTFKRLSALATATRTAIYPVDTGGLRTPLDPDAQPFGGPPMLRRLANETGGRMTSETNEIGVAYAKAHRDLGCTYTLGFYEPWPDADKKRRMTIRVQGRPGLRVVYPEFYVVRSPEEQRKSLFRTAANVPQMFDSEEMSTNLFVLGPDSPSRWRALLAVEYEPQPGTFIEDGERWELKGLVRKPNGTIVSSFKDRIHMPRTDPANGTPTLTLFRELRVRPGRYIVSAILSDPRGKTPVASTYPAVLARIPRGEPFLVGPLLGRRTDDRAAADSDDRPEFEPLIAQEAVQGAPLDSLTVVCVVDSKEPVGVRRIARSVTSWEGVGAVRLDPVSVELSRNRKVSCHEVVDHLATAELQPGRYELTAVAETSDRITGRGTTEFTIVPPAAD